MGPSVPRTGSGKKRPRRWPIRRFIRALHRDAGYLVVGLTLVYALSGLAVNHLADWDPNFASFEGTFELPASLRSVPAPRLAAQGEVDDQGASPDAATSFTYAKKLLASRGRDPVVQDAYWVDDQHLDITLEHSTLFIDFSNGTVREEGQRPRWLLRAINWLHLNRGKQAWTYVADGYALLLLYLAFSGLFMIAGKKGLWGRGGVLAALGAALPIVYVLLSGGP